MDDSISHTDVAQEFVAQALALGCTLDQAGNVNKLNDCRGGLLGVIHLGQLVQTVVRHCHHAHIGVDGTERIVGALSTGIGNSIKQGALAHIGQTHDT